MDANGILQGQHLYRITGASFTASEPIPQQDLAGAGIKTASAGQRFGRAPRTETAQAHTRFDDLLGAGPLAQVREIADTEAAPKPYILDLPIDGVNNVTWNVDDGDVASMLLTESMTLNMAGGKPGQVAYLFVRSPGGLAWNINLASSSITPIDANTVIQGTGVNVMKFIKAAVHVIDSAGQDNSTWHYLGFERKFAIADNSITPAKAQAGLAIQKRDWRARIDASHIGVQSTTLPSVTNHNIGDTIILGRGSTNTGTAYQGLR